MNTLDPQAVRDARMMMPATVREHAATMGGVITFWREVVSDMHGEARKVENHVDAGVVDCWLEKLDFLLKVACDSHDEFVEEARTAGYTQQGGCGGGNSGHWHAPGAA